MPKGGLGKGLNALLSNAAAESGSNTSDIIEVPLGAISPNPNQPRTDFDEKGIEELAESIKKEGLLQPIVVRPDGKKYQIIAGERRWQACKSLGMDQIPVKVMKVDEVKTLELALIENLQRTNLNPIEEARGYKALIKATGMTQEQLAATVCKSRTTITNAIRLLDLPEEVQELVYDGKLTSGHARAILAMSDEEKRIQLAERIVKDNLSVRDAENLARLLNASQGERAKRTPSPRIFKTVARKLRQELGTTVQIKNSRGKNRIEIGFQDEDDLVRIFNVISGKLEEMKSTGKAEEQ